MHVLIACADFTFLMLEHAAFRRQFAAGDCDFFLNADKRIRLHQGYKGNNPCIND